MPASPYSRLVPAGLALLLAAASPASPLSGRMTLAASPATHFEVHYDRFGYAAGGGEAIRELPAMGFTLVQDGEFLLPIEQGIRDVGHPHWEVALQTGRIRTDLDGERHAELPFALVERNANCTHNGLLAWRLDDGGRVSRASWRIAAETCAYYKFDMRGTVKAVFDAGPVESAGEVRATFRAYRRARLPVVAIERIGERYPEVDSAAFGAVGGMNPDDMTVYGFVAEGIHYRSGCSTRDGAYPFCDEMLLPAYSTAKSIFAGLAFMRLELLLPGSAERPIASLVPACDAAGWQGVTVGHALDMATGRYDDVGPEVDEGSESHVDFLYAETHAERIRRACTLFRRREEPGHRFVYHTSDTYVAGAAMRALLERAYGRNVALYRELLGDPAWRELHLSPIARQTRTTYDETRQPLTGWGLTFVSDDVARIGNWLNAEGARIGGEAVLDGKLLDAAMQRDPAGRGLEAGSPHFRYNNGFWAHDIAAYVGCGHPVWVPFMSGYGGISVVLFPNGSTYYYFSDGYTQRWREAAVAADQIGSLCS